MRLDLEVRYMCNLLCYQKFCCCLLAIPLTPSLLRCALGLGLKGDRGNTGLTGDKGDPGDPGLSGISKNGVQGPKGLPGCQGI